MLKSNNELLEEIRNEESTNLNTGDCGFSKVARSNDVVSYPVSLLEQAESGDSSVRIGYVVET